jgi:hypothetical protein
MGYTFQHTQGMNFEGETSQNLSREVAPGEEITLKLNLKAPDQPGTYTGRWEIFADDGRVLGWYSVVIDVMDDAHGETIFAVTSVKWWIDGYGYWKGEEAVLEYKGNCNDLEGINVDGVYPEITTNGSGTVTGYIETSQNNKKDFKKSCDPKCDNSRLDPAWITNFWGHHWVKLYIDQPNHQWFGPVTIQYKCE